MENRFTAEGQHLHRRAHEGPGETRDGVRIARGVPLRSLELGLAGVADVVQYRPGGRTDEGGRMKDELRRARERGDWEGWTITPIEYKRGRPKGNDCDRVQLCAQALCLEEIAPRGGASRCSDTSRRNCRGVAALPGEKHRGLLQRWAQQSGLRVASFV